MDSSSPGPYNMRSDKMKDQQQLVSILYSVHNKLRHEKQQAKEDDEKWQKAWKQHTSDQKTLKEYSKAMHALATKIWDPRNKSIDLVSCPAEDDSVNPSMKLKCRLEWVVSRCKEYFNVSKADEKLKLLDVGSCYNPFSQFREIFEIVAIDLCPAPGFEVEMFQCDFTEIDVVEMKVSNLSLQLKTKTSLSHLPKNYFNVVVFSYFLEYLADTKQRQKCCEKAYQLLAPNGLLFVLRPDSNRVTPGGNNVLIKKLKVAMAILGFKRIYFEKLEHLWCMAFRKLDNEERKKILSSSYFKADVSKVSAEFAVDNFDRLHELFCISQDNKSVDVNDTKEDGQGLNCVEASSSHLQLGAELSAELSLLQELPGCDI